MARSPRFPRNSRGRPGPGQLSLFSADGAALPDGADADRSVFDDAPESLQANVDAWDYYNPTKTSNPARPRTMSSRYSKENRLLEVRFREGAVYQYHDVHPNTWRGFKNTDSPGRYINRILNGHPYNPGEAGNF